METTRPMMATDGVKLSWRGKLLNVQNELHALDLDNFKCDLDDELDCAVTRDLINGYFVATFKKNGDLEFVLTGGPWVISGQYLVIHKWKPGFDANSSKITRTAVWVKILRIQAEFLDVWALKRIGSFLGKALKIDALTLARARGKFARICIELDLTKPLEAYVQLNGAWFNLEYEGLPDICFKCEVYGHRRVVVLSLLRWLVMFLVIVDGSVKESVLGPWMIVQTKRRGKKMSGEVASGSNKGATGSRFSVLSKEDNSPSVFKANIGSNVGGDAASTKVWTLKVKKTTISNRAHVADFSNSVHKGGGGGRQVVDSRHSTVTSNPYDNESRTKSR
ncbi:hypothetical protein FF1_017991 [Malus domestica]